MIQSSKFIHRSWDLEICFLKLGFRDSLDKIKGLTEPKVKCVSEPFLQTSRWDDVPCRVSTCVLPLSAVSFGL